MRGGSPPAAQPSGPSRDASTGSSVRPRRKTWPPIWAAAGLAVAAYLAADQLYAVRHPGEIRFDLFSETGRFVLRPSDYLSFAAVKQARLDVRTERRLSGVGFSVSNPATGRLEPRPGGVRRLSDRRFVLPVGDDLLDSSLELVARDPAPKRLRVRAVLRPELRWHVLPFQWAAGVLILLFVFSSAAAGLRVVRPGSRGPAVHVRRSVLAFLGLGAVFFLYAAAHAGSYVRILDALRVRAGDIAVLNLAGAAVLAGLAVLFQRTRLPLIGLPILFGLAFAAFGWTYRIPICGDADQWIHQLMDGRANPAAELLGFALARGIFRGLRSVRPDSSPLAVLSLLGKSAGVLYAFVLYRMSATLRGASRDRKIVFFLAAAVLPVSVFFSGYPEFAYWPLPFLLLGVLAAERYLAAGGGLTSLCAAAACVTAAALFHAGSLACVPSLALLPFLKAAPGPDGGRLPAARIARDALAALAVAAVLAGGVLWLHRSAGIPLQMDNVRGGGDGDRFVEFFPTARVAGGGAIFLEIRYLWLGGWTVLIGIPLALLALAGRLRTWAARDDRDLVLFLFGAPLVLLFLFWNHDLGFRDFDLLVAPLTLFQLLALKAVLDGGHEGVRGRGAPLVAALAATSGVFLILRLTTGG